MKGIAIGFYEALISVGSLLQSPLLLICRIYWGVLFMKAGYGKLQNITPFAEYLDSIHFVYPLFQAYLAGLTEFIGGLCLILGFASRLVSIPLAVVMITAYSTAHVEAARVFFKDPSQFVAQSPFNFLLVTLLVFAFGPGIFSVDYFLQRRYFKK